MKTVIKSSDSLDSNILSQTEEFPSNSRWGFFRYLTGMTLITSTLSPTEEFTSNIWSNFFHYLTGTDLETWTSTYFHQQKIYGTFLVECLPLFDWDWSPLPRQFHKQKNLHHIFRRFFPLYDRNWPPIHWHFHQQKNLRQICGGVSSTVWTEQTPATSMVKPYLCRYVVWSTRSEINRNLFRYQGRFYVIGYLLLKIIWRIYRFH